MRTILLLLDGLGDRGHPIFQGKTPLQMAFTPNLDHISKMGTNGLYHSSVQGIAMSSELAHFLMFGYDIQEFPGRGFIEAKGFDIPLDDSDVVLLARIFSVSIQNGLLILEEEDPDVDEMTCRALQEEIRFFEKDGFEIEFVPTEGIEGILVIRGRACEKITDSNPIFKGRPLMEVCPFEGIEGESDAALKTAEVLNSYLVWCHQKLSGHPANKTYKKMGLPQINALGTQRAGKKKQLLSFTEKWGLRGLSIASGAVYRGLCRTIGMDTLRAKDTGNHENDLLERLKLAKENEDFDFIHVHTKAPDMAAHTKNPEHKKDVIESLDRALFFAIDEILSDDEILFVVTSDHSTPSAGNMIHSGEPVPVTMKGKHTRRDGVSEFNEISCAGGGLGFLQGVELMHLILNFLDKGKLWSLMDSPRNQPYSPGNYKPLKIE